jgi:hypothetical protein
MVSPFEIRWLPASISSSTFCGSSAFVLQDVVSRVQPLRPTRGAVCLASDLVSESWRVPVLRFASAGWTPRRALLPRKRPFFARCRERLELRARSPWAKTVAHFDKLLCLPARRSKPVLPSERRSPERGTIEQTRTGRPTQVAQADGWRSFSRRLLWGGVASRSGGGLHGPLA